MVWVRFLKNFSYKPSMQVTQDYPAGVRVNVTRECADVAIAASAAELDSNGDDSKKTSKAEKKDD